MPRTVTEPRQGGQFTEKQINVGSLLAADHRSQSKRVAKNGDGAHGDQRKG
jgi:hypothetical protein